MKVQLGWISVNSRYVHHTSHHSSRSLLSVILVLQLLTLLIVSSWAPRVSTSANMTDNASSVHAVAQKLKMSEGETWLARAVWHDADAYMLFYLNKLIINVQKVDKVSCDLTPLVWKIIYRVVRQWQQRRWWQVDEIVVLISMDAVNTLCVSPHGYPITQRLNSSYEWLDCLTACYT